MKHFVMLMTLLWVVGSAYGQRTITGTITDADNNPLMGATVLAKGTTVGAFSDIDGLYSLDVPEGTTILSFSYVGYTTQEQEIGTSNTLDVTLVEGLTVDNVVVTALGISREEKSLGYAVQKVDGDALNEAKEVNVVNSLQGKIAGVQITGASGNMGGSSRILIRGANSVTGQNQPLFVVDGVPVDNSNFTSADQARGGGGYDYGNAIQDINPDDIESVTVLKGPTAAALYGSRAANGVIMIKTKTGKNIKKKKGIGVSINAGVTFDQVAVLPKFQNEYGGGFGFDTLWASADPDAFIDGNGNGVIDQGEGDYYDANNGSYALLPNYAVDESWGPKLDQGTMVRHWDSWDKTDSENYLKAREWKSNPNNIRDFFRTGVTFSNNISFGGATEKSAFRLSYTNLHQDFVYDNSRLDRNSVNFTGSTTLAEKLHVAVNATYVGSAAKGRPGTGYDGNTVTQQFYQWGQRQWDVQRMKDNYISGDGVHQTWNRKSYDDGTPQYTDNPFWTLNENYQNDSRNRFFGNFALTYDITEKFRIRGRAMTDFYSDRREERIAIQSQNTPKYEESVRNVHENNFDFMFNYNDQFGDDFSLNAFVGTNYMMRSYHRNVEETVGGINVPGFYNVANSTNSPKVDDYLEQKAIYSVFGSASLGYKNMLYLDITARNDWSSTLPAGKRSYFYPSTTLSFVFSELLNAKWFSFGKVRVGWAQAGNDASPYKLDPVYNPSIGRDERETYGINGNPVTVLTRSMNNPNLRNELTSSIEAGIDVRFFQNRLGLDFTFYNNISTNQIINLELSPTTGATSATINSGKMLNRGIEVMLNGTPVKSKSFRWDASLNLAHNYNEVVELHPDVENLSLQTAPFAVSVNAKEGEGYGTIMGYDFVYDDAGNKLVDAAGRYARTDEVVPLGNVMAKMTGGLNNNFSYKGVYLGFLIDFQWGGSLFSTTNMWAKYSGMTEETIANNIREDGIVVDGVYEEGTTIDGTDVSGQQNTSTLDANSHFFYNQGYRIAAADVYDASYIKLREVRLGYNFPKSLVSKIGLQSARLSVVGRNIAILFKNIPHLDPEAALSTDNVQGIEGAQLPSIRSIGINLNLTF
ncbi:MAG: SusC/RagA family TonB-linked outer membrane protein [Aureispira sp.]|nr:SusC/RagA family TonB-linked outer membrane protein [Aureispira sp.]